MASEERDRNFDKAIARHLRSRPSANSISRDDACPDAETLAAFHERSLLPPELKSWTEHIASCSQCQELLAHLEATDEIPLPAAEEEELPLTRPISAAPSQTEPAADARPDRARAKRLSRGARWRWLAPAGAIAAGLLVWIATHENRSPVLPSADETKMAKNQEPPAAAPQMDRQVPPALPREELRLPKSPSATDESAASSARTESGAVRRSRTAPSGARVRSATPAQEKDGTVQFGAERSASADQDLRENRADLDAKTAAAPLQRKIEPQAQSGNVQSQNLNNLNSPKVAGPAPLGQLGAAKKMKASPPRSPPPAPAAAGGYSAGAAMETVMVSAPGLITAPGSNFVWRTGRAGLIEFSHDGGHSWSRQPSGVLVDLLTGFAPGEKVCWIVGRTGAILLTTDGGEHWKLISSPLKEDLGGITATDALHATVWNARGTKTFTTSNGGLTWERVL
jgi:hypothetical protein